MAERLEQRYCIEFCQKLGDSQVETIRNIQMASGDDAMGSTQIKQRYKRFKDGRTSVESEPCSGRPSTCRNDQVIAEVNDVVMRDHRVTIQEIAEKVGISTFSAHSIITEDLAMKTVAAKFVLKLLTVQQKQLRVELSQDMLDSTNSDLDFMNTIITDESLVYRHRSTTINIKTTLEMLYGSWNEVRQSTIRNCFADAGFVLPADEEEVQPEDQAELDRTWDRLAVPGVEFDDFVSADENLAVAPELTDQEIVDRVLLPEDDSSSDSGESERDEPTMSSADAADMARRLKGYLEKLPTTKTADVEKALLSMDNVENFILRSAVKSHQTKITSFFK
ncbi:hypothetical protein V5799_024191 [Amblyomma americanum]|uniref:Mos1 transposase HTH domain-containing protein n=1 Tax=Amblyomma americanum TaxID=6943 RepID=A0AAQ4ECT3_AMBAM